MIKDLVIEIRHNKGAFFGLILVSFFCLMALFAPIIAPHSPDKIFENASTLSFFSHASDQTYFLLGTDDLGRDMLSRLVFGARISIMIGISVVFISATIGTFLGLIAGFYGSLIDRVIMRFTDLILALPSVLFAIVVVSVLGVGIRNAIIAVSIVIIPNFTKLVRAQVLVERNKQYVIAQKTFGASDMKILFKEILPNCMAPIIVQSALALSEGILNTAALGFLGLGAQAPMAEWGTMLSDARAYIENAPHMVTLPGMCIFLLVLGLNLLGDAIRDALDPKLKKHVG